MARPLPNLGAERVAELETAWAKQTEHWERKRLQVLRLVAQHKLNAEEIAEAVDVGRTTVFRYMGIYVTPPSTTRSGFGDGRGLSQDDVGA